MKTKGKSCYINERLLIFLYEDFNVKHVRAICGMH